MEIAIKQLSQNSKVIFPQTAAEAVLVKKGSAIITLDKALSFKLEAIETPAGSGLNSYQQGSTIVITHSNTSVTPNQKPEPLLVQHDDKGHIVNTLPMKSFTVMVDGEKIIESNGAEDKTLMFGDDFKVDNKGIALKWTNI